jgi:hypothetical protein
LKHPAAGRLSLAVTIAALALAGCSAGGSSSPASSGSSASPAAMGGSSSPASSGSSGGSAPSWAAALGPGTTVTPPQSAAPGHESPGAAVQGYVAAFFNKDLAAACDYAEPSVQSACKTDVAKIPSGTTLPSMQNEALGYVATHGTQALVGITGSICTPGATPACTTNSDPAAIFSSGKPFATQWSQAQAAAAKSSNAYSLLPCIQVGGQWYADVPASSL